tara:strand:+ start:216 stop:905 length:690 start_codon:yes stop_codon:yes gene_type:complete
MDYLKSGIIFYKKIDSKYYFLLAKNNLNILNEYNNFYSDIGGTKKISDSNSKDTAARSFYENTFGLPFQINDLIQKIDKTYENKKYRHIIHFIEEDLNSDLLLNINSVRSYLNNTLINSENDFLKKKDCSLQGYSISNNIKWFELSEIICNPDNFDKKFMNSFLKSIKKLFLYNDDQIYNKNTDDLDDKKDILMSNNKIYNNKKIENQDLNDKNFSEKVNSQFYTINNN